MRFVLLQFLLVLYALHEADTCSNITVMTNPPQLCSSHPCHFSSLDDLAIPHDLMWDTTINITFCTESLDLNVVIEFANISEVRMRGGGGDYSDQTEVWCQGGHAGIKFTGVQRVHIEHMRLRECGMPFGHGDVTKASVIIFRATRVTVNNFITTNPTETGLALIDVATSDIDSCVFERESHSRDWRAMQSGLYIESNWSGALHVISGCNFTGSAGDPATSWSHEAESTTCWDQEGGNAGMTADHHSADTSTRGAGVRVHLKNLSSNNSVLVTGCSFTQNAAQWGGGVYIGIQDSSEDNEVTISASEFSENCAHTGGGAVAVGLLYSSWLGAPPTNNRVKITECTFTGNTAMAGGAVQVSYSQLETHRKELVESRNEIQLDNCTWKNNTAHHGAAIDIRPIKMSGRVTDMLPPPLVTLRDCKFEKNTVKWIRDNNVHIRGAGTVKLKKAELQIEGILQLMGCTGSALYLESSIAEFANSSRTTFTDNKGHRGAAIAMMGGQRSVISVQDNSHVLFRDNKAETIGGAVFQENSEDCFITRGEESEATIATKSVLEFDNNTAKSDVGHSVFVNSLKSCMEVYKTENYQEALGSIADFQLMQNRSHEVATFGRVILDGTLPSAVVPGKKVKSSLNMLDDTNATVVITAIIVSIDSQNVHLVTGYTVHGKPGSMVQIAITPYHRQEFQLVINVTLSTCPPGYYYDEEEEICACSSSSQSNRYIGIQACNHHNFRASLLHSHWAGYMESEGQGSNNSIGEAVFRTAYCPRGFCAYSNKTRKDVLLPSEAEDDLSSYVCRENRVGVLCSRCEANHSAFYPRYACRRNKRCELGGLYYVLTQILPVTILFSLLLAFDVNLTSGQVGGVILYMQMVDALLLTANDFLWFEPPVYKILLSLRVISRMTNLQFFAHRKLSFCLWEGATSLDSLAFNYVTVIYSFVLVIFTVKVVSPLILRIKKHFRRQIGMEQAKSRSIIHGLTGFLVLCYSQNTHTSLHLLASGALHGRGNKQAIGLRVFFNGEMKFFENEHLPYAIPATLMLITITVLPPLLLLSYPLCYRVLALCRIQESKFTRVLCRVVPLERYKPLFDSFQGSFKDDHRYFAGLYFMYRFVWLVTLSHVRELASFYIILEVELVLMLLLHAYAQPHKNKWHNRVDTCLFALLAIVNAGTIYGYHKRNDYTHPLNYVQVVNTIQIMLVCLPPLSMTGYLAWVGVRFARRKFKGSVHVDRKEGGGESVEMEGSRSQQEEQNSRIGYNIFADRM